MQITDDLVSELLQFETGQLDDKEAVDFFQTLIDNGLINELDYSYQLLSKSLTEAGLCHAPIKEAV